MSERTFRRRTKKKRAKERKKNSLSPPSLSLSLSPLLSHLHPPLDRDLLHVPRPVRLAAEGRVPHPDARALAPPEEREVGDLEGHRAVEEVREVEVGRVVADDDIRVRLDDEVPVFFVLFFVFFVSFFFPERGRNGEKREKRGELLSLSLSFGVKETQRIKILSKNSPPPPQQARLVLEGHHFRSGDRGARVEREDVLYRRGGLALDL